MIVVKPAVRTVFIFKVNRNLFSKVIWGYKYKFCLLLTIVHTHTHTHTHTCRVSMCMCCWHNVSLFIPSYYTATCFEARGGALGWGTVLQAGRSQVQFPIMSLDFFILIIRHAVALGSTQPLTEMSTRNISWGLKATGAQG